MAVDNNKLLSRKKRTGGFHGFFLARRLAVAQVRSYSCKRTALGMNKMERVLRQALATFSGPYTSKTFHDNLVGLVRSANELDAPSVGLDVRLLWRDAHELDLEEPPPPSSAPRRRLRAPVTYIDVFENEDVSVGVFVLRNGATIPLHDHPYMYGVLKVIRGKVRIQSYTPRQKDYSRLE